MHSTAVLKNKNRYNNKSSIGISLKAWINNHKRSCLDSFKTLYRAPLSNMLTMSILGITLALPILLYFIILNLNNSITSWQDSLYQYDLYLDTKYSAQDAEKIKQDVIKWPEVDKVNIISKDEALVELKTIMGIDNILTNIEDNPLPVIINIIIKPEYHSLDNIKNLLARSKDLSGIVKADADIFLLERISKILMMFSIVIYVFSAALSLAVLLVIANTIRLVLQTKQQEMKVLSLLGATDSYIRRPYLYGGMFYGLFTGILGLAVASYLFNTLYYYFVELGGSFFHGFNIIGFDISNMLALLIASSFLGWLGARLSFYWQMKHVSHTLDEI